MRLLVLLLFLLASPALAQPISGVCAEPQPELLHNLSLTAERQGQIGPAIEIEYEERWLAAARADLASEEGD